MTDWNRYAGFTPDPPETEAERVFRALQSAPEGSWLRLERVDGKLTIRVVSPEEVRSFLKESP